MASVIQTSLREYLPLVASGKVREVYSLDDSELLFVATDRISGIAWPIVH
jgi:phosphoribosylaminoimidazole-succinocarboxamide synthase